jgi:hypothetical protein
MSCVSLCVCGELGGVYGYVVAAGILCRGGYRVRQARDNSSGAQERHCQSRNANTLTRDQQVRRPDAFVVVAVEACVVAQPIHSAKTSPHLRAPQVLPNPRSSSSSRSFVHHQRRRRAASRLYPDAANLLCCTNSNTIHPPNRTLFPHLVASSSPPSSCLPSTPTARTA